MRHVLQVIRQIMQQSDRERRLPVLQCYLRLILKSVLFHKAPGIYRSIFNNLRRENIHGYTIQFLNYGELIDLYEEIFIFEVYKTASVAPSVIIDCGSNIGLSIIYFHIHFRNCPILSFEPSRLCYEVLKENISLNNISHVIAHNAALSDKEGQAVLTHRDSWNSSLTKTVFLSQGQVTGETVRLTKLSNYITFHGSMIKMDVEGSEIQIIKDMIDSKKIENVQTMVIEFHPDLTQVGLQPLLAQLDECGFISTVVPHKNHADSQSVLIHSIRP